ncbi:MAG: S41 family peptidase [Bacteroidota bacterium]
MFGRILLFLLTFSCLSGLAQKTAFPGSELKKFSQEDLRSDLLVLKNILEANHPSLYWYTSREKLDSAFSATLAGINDSMNELDFKNRVATFVSEIRCGHTVVRSSQRYSKNASLYRFPLFPLSIKLWQDSMVVLSTLSGKDQLLSRGTRLLSINGRDARFFADTFARHISVDGFGRQFSNQLVSNNFGAFYKNILGLDSVYHSAYIHSTGQRADTVIKNIFPASMNPSAEKVSRDSIPRLSRRERKKWELAEKRRLQMDTVAKTTYMMLGSFSGRGTASFIRSSFRKMRKSGISNLIIDLRSNGGGKVSNSTLLTRYLSNHNFRVADTVVRSTGRLKYKQHIQQAWLYQLGLLFSGRRQSDGRFHFSQFERKVWQPKKRNHFEGNVYLIQGGFSFSASTLLLGELRGQRNIRLVGEETGGAYYGNSAMLIPGFTLPHSKIRGSLPLFRVVAGSGRPRGGGILPDVAVPPSSEAIRRGIDPKMEKIKSLIAGEKE